MTTIEQVQALIRKVKKIELPLDQLTVEARLIDDLKLDSLALMELLVLTEQAFNFEFTHEEAASVKTIGQMVEFIDARKPAA